MRRAGRRIHDGKYGLRMTIVDLNEKFNSMGNRPIVVNDIDFSSGHERERLAACLYQTHSGDELDMVPQCSHGCTKSTYALGDICPCCNTRVERITDRPIEPDLWMRPPDGIEYFINPTIWGILRHYLSKGSFSLLDWMTHKSTYRPVKDNPALVAKAKSIGLPTTYNEFVERYDEVIDLLSDNRMFDCKRTVKDKLVRFLKRYRDRTFVKHLPFPSRLTMVIEKNGEYRYADHSSIELAVDALLGIVALNTAGEVPSMRVREARCVETMTKLYQHYMVVERERVYSKPGVYRKLAFGFNSHWSARTVVVSRWGEHDYDEIVIPWSVTVSLLTLHISSKLLFAGYSPTEAVTMIRTSVRNPVPVVKQVVDEIVAEMGGYIPVVHLRNPTLERSAQQRFRAVPDTDYRATVTRISGMSTRGPNCDFDGDEMGIGQILDLVSDEHLSRFKPHLSVMSLRGVFTVGQVATIPSPAELTALYWLSDGDKQCPVQ